MIVKNAPDVGLIEPTEDERANGWTAASLTQYVREREKAQTAAVLFREKPRPPMANGRYSTFKWREV